MRATLFVLVAVLGCGSGSAPEPIEGWGRPGTGEPCDPRAQTCYPYFMPLEPMIEGQWSITSDLRVGSIICRTMTFEIYEPGKFRGTTDCGLSAAGAFRGVRRQGYGGSVAAVTLGLSNGSLSQIYDMDLSPGPSFLPADGGGPDAEIDLAGQAQYRPIPGLDLASWIVATRTARF